MDPTPAEVTALRPFKSVSARMRRLMPVQDANVALERQLDSEERALTLNVRKRLSAAIFTPGMPPELGAGADNARIIRWSEKPQQPFFANAAYIPASQAILPTLLKKTGARPSASARLP